MATKATKSSKETERVYARPRKASTMAQEVREVLTNIPMSDADTHVRPEFLRKFRKALGMPQYAFAQVLGCTNISIHVWEKKGITDIKGPGLAMLKALVALFKYAIRFPDKLDLDELCMMVKTGSERTLIDRFITRAHNIEPDVLSSINQGMLPGVLLAVLVEVIENNGKLPGRDEVDISEPFEPIDET